MFGFIKNVFFYNNDNLWLNCTSVNTLKFVSMNNQECKTRTKIADINNNEPTFYPYSIKINAVEVVIILMIYTQNYVFLMLSKT